MFRKVNKLQFDVDELLALWPEMDQQTQTEYQQLGEMILKAQDGALNKRGLKRMERLFRNDEGALRYYVDFQMLTVLLHEYFGDHRVAELQNLLNLQVSP